MDCPEAKKVQVEVATVRPRSFSHTPASQSSATPQQLSKASRCRGMGGGGSGRREAIEQELKKLRAEREDLDGRIRLLESELEAVPLSAGGSGGAIPSRLLHHLRPPLSDMDCPEAKKVQVEVACPPDDSLVEIFSRLHAKPLFRFKCVSKDWCSLITDRLRCRKFPQTLEGFFAGQGDESYGGFIDLSGRPVPLVDPSFSFLPKLPESEKIILLGSSNGLILFGHRRVSDRYDTLGYTVCNPATEEWVFVPSPSYTNNPWESDDSDDEEYQLGRPGSDTYLIFDPAISPHFQLIHFRFGCLIELVEVHTFSSVIGSWSLVDEGVPERTMLGDIGACLSNGMLHVGTQRQPWYPPENKHMILAVGGDGRPFRTLHWPDNDRGFLVFVGQSQGHLHCLSGFSTNVNQLTMTELSIWVLEDCNAEKWVLRDNVSFSQLFGTMSGRFLADWNVVGIHPDRGLVFIIEYWNRWNRKLISYDIDKKEVHSIFSLHGYHWPYIPYVPYFAQSAALAKKP